MTADERTYVIALSRRRDARDERDALIAAGYDEDHLRHLAEVALVSPIAQRARMDDLLARTAVARLYEPEPVAADELLLRDIERALRDGARSPAQAPETRRAA